MKKAESGFSLSWKAKGKIVVLPSVLNVQLFGTWRSPVAYLHGVQGVASSNLVVPTGKGCQPELTTFYFL